MSELTKYWAWDYEIKPLGSFPQEEYTGHNKAVEVYLATDVDALLDDPQALAAYLIDRQKGQP